MIIKKSPIIHAAIYVAVILLLYHFIFSSMNDGASAQAGDYMSGYEDME